MKKYTFTAENFANVLGVLAWSAVSAILATLILVVEDTEFPTQYMMFVPVINTILYALKEWASK